MKIETWYDAATGTHTASVWCCHTGRTLFTTRAYGTRAEAVAAARAWRAEHGGYPA